MDAEGSEHQNTKDSTFGFLNDYKRAHHNPANRLSARMERRAYYDGVRCKPDIELCTLYPQNPEAGQMQRILPFVVVEGDIHNCTIPETITKARLLLSEPHVHRVAAFKIFPSRPETAATGNLSKGAVAIEFERDGVFQQGVLAAIRVVQEVSFGTAELDISVPQNLCEVPSRNSPADVIRRIAPSPLQAAAISINSETELLATLPLGANPFVVDLTPRMEHPLLFDLNEIFSEAVLGWNCDRMARAATMTA